MGGKCNFWKKTSAVIGAAMMIAGTLILLASLPAWMWLTILGIALTAAGFLILRFA